jgi:hypothetical protein
MADERAWWRRVFDSAEGAVAPPLEALVRTDEFARVTATLTWARATVRHGLADVSAAAWHLVNLPAGSDLAHLRSQVGALDREVRRLALRLEQERLRDRPVEEATGDRTERDVVERPGPHPSGRRPHHPPSP